MAKKQYALDPAEREKECTHELGFAYRGSIPCTGPRICYMCGERGGMEVMTAEDGRAEIRDIMHQAEGRRRG